MRSAPNISSRRRTCWRWRCRPGSWRRPIRNRRLNVKELRDRTGISRHLSVPLVEYFDQIGLTRRDEVGRHFRRDPRQVFEG
ncbi:MAG: SelB C-terminal domain-containing protein [Rubrivivax sp.]|nr:SelB C-terminal domain-containing protein [Rubrivivax sp.]